MIHYFYLPTKIFVGYGELRRLGDEVKKLDAKSALVVFSRRFAIKYGYAELISKLLRESGIKYEFYFGVKPNPPASQCDEIAAIARRLNVDVIIAFGGGSVIDASKAAATVATLGGSVKDYFYPNVVSEEVLPVIAIPTTCGTGSEVTKYAIITDEDSKRKAVIVGESIIPRVALVDPNVLKHLPKNMIIWTALDALSHAIEAYMSRAANAFSEAYSLESLNMILSNIFKAVNYDSNALLNLHLASTMAGIAINLAGTILIHALGYYLTTHHGIHHGLANAIVMPFALYYLLRSLNRSKVAKLLKALKANSEYEALKLICNLLNELGIPNSLHDIGLNASKVREYVSNVVIYKRNLENTPMDIDEETIENIIRDALRGRRELIKRLRNTSLR